MFETIERPVMQTLRQDDYEYAEWHLARAGIDYHVEVQGFFYSVPHSLIREQVDTRAIARTIEVFHRGKCVAARARRYGGPRHGTLRNTCRARIGDIPNGRRSACNVRGARSGRTPRD